MKILEERESEISSLLPTPPVDTSDPLEARLQKWRLVKLYYWKRPWQYHPSGLLFTVDILLSPLNTVVWAITNHPRRSPLNKTPDRGLERKGDGAPLEAVHGTVRRRQKQKPS